MHDPVQVLFVCSGNICRSPMAELIARERLARAGVPAHVASAGTLGIEAHAAGRYAVAVLEEIGLDLTSHASRGIDVHAIEAADWIVVMSPEHESPITGLSPNATSRIVRLWEHAPDRPEEIFDPVGRDVDTFRACRDLLVASIERWIETLLEKRSRS